MLLSTPDGRQALQQARLQATTGHAEEAVASYNKLFNGAPPEGDIAVSTGVRWRKFRLAVAKRLIS